MRMRWFKLLFINENEMVQAFVRGHLPLFMNENEMVQVFTFIDLAGHERYIKTTVSGMTGLWRMRAFYEKDRFLTGLGSGCRMCTGLYYGGSGFEYGCAEDDQGASWCCSRTQVPPHLCGEINQTTLSHVCSSPPASHSRFSWLNPWCMSICFLLCRWQR